MKWIKKGLIYGPTGESTWAKHSALQPTPIAMNESVISVFAGFRDENGVSRIGRVDLSMENPSEVIAISNEPVLDIGKPGAFDDNGVVPTAVVKRDNCLFLYYAGYQKSYRVRFLAFCGLAVSHDGGINFKRIKEVPVLDRVENETLFRVIHSIILDNGNWKVWYGAGSEFIKGHQKTLPAYNIRYMESPDGINFPQKGQVVIDTNKGEHRVGRPYVLKHGDTYRMFFGAGTEIEPYKLCYAESYDGITWKRKDEEIGIALSSTGWDSKMMAYPAIVKYKQKTYMFYNGNDMGKEGFGYAELAE